MCYYQLYPPHKIKVYYDILLLQYFVTQTHTTNNVSRALNPLPYYSISFQSINGITIVKTFPLCDKYLHFLLVRDTVNHSVMLNVNSKWKSSFTKLVEILQIRTNIEKHLNVKSSRIKVTISWLQTQKIQKKYQIHAEKYSILISCMI